jgi:hypothetical protein
LNSLQFENHESLEWRVKDLENKAVSSLYPQAKGEKEKVKDKQF